MRYLLIIIVVTVGCTRQNQPEERKKAERTAYDVHFQKVLDAFWPLDHRLDSLTDSNSMVFYKEHRWDTSFLLIIRKDTASIKVSYHEISPENSEAYLKTDVAFYEGFTFDADIKLWNRIIDESRFLMDTVYHKWDLGCCDRRSYLISHASKYTVNNSLKNEDALEQYAQFLRRMLIYPIYRKKKEFDNRPNPNN